MKVAIKLLTQSDRSFFKVHLRLSKQKAINLNRDVFIDRFYPGLQGVYTTIGFPLSVVGPGGRTAHRLMRKVLRSGGGKNWRLNGEFIYDPDDEPGRYDRLQDNDFAIMAFDGTERPEGLTLVLVSAIEDAPLHEAISALGLVGRDSMREVSETFIAELRSKTAGAYVADHPLDAIAFRDTIEEVLFGAGDPITAGVPSSGLSAPMTPDELRRQLLTAGETGQRGEALFADWLTSTGHEEGDFDWVALMYARSAFDFEVKAARWISGAPRVFVDVKTSRGPFDSPIHMSIAQIRFAAATPAYRIARIYDFGGAAPKLTLLNGVDGVAASVLEALGSLPQEVMIESLQLPPKLLQVEYVANLPLEDS